MEEFISRDAKTFSIKFIFDHIRNIGLCSLLFLSAGALIKGNISGADSWPIPPEINGYVLLAFGIALMLANLVQFLYVGAKSSTGYGKYVYGFIGLLLTVWAQASIYGLLHVQVQGLICS